MMKTGIKQLSIFVLFLLSYPCIANEQNGVELELDGLLLDHAITVQGHEFYRYFSHSFQKPVGLHQSSLVIKEKPSARWGSMIWVESNSKVLFKTFIRPGRANIKSNAEFAARIVEQQLFQIAMNGIIKQHDLDESGY